MRKERRKIKHIKLDLARSYSGMEAKVDSRAKEVFKRKPYSVVHAGPGMDAGRREGASPCRLRDSSGRMTLFCYSGEK